VSPLLTANAMRYDCMRMRPASFTAAAPPSSCQETQSVSAVEISASSKKGVPTMANLAPKLHRACVAVIFGDVGTVAGISDCSICVFDKSKIEVWMIYISNGSDFRGWIIKG
jgi:hypothetical protein